MGLNFLSWNWLPLLPVFVVYVISGLAETNRHPFDVVEGESEIVAGHMVEYSGMSFAMFFLAEYANMWLVSITTAIMFLGGWIAPVEALSFIPGWIWLGLKTFCVVTLFLWVRATFPLRPNHAFELENFYPRHAGVAGRSRRLDADLLEHLEITRANHERHLQFFY
jgi:NADH-quinone oxidoreductase subunit H